MLRLGVVLSLSQHARALFFLALASTTYTMAAPVPEVYIHLLGTDDPNLNGTVIVAGKQMTIDICCLARRDYALEVAQGTCAAPSKIPAAVIAANLDWRFNRGHLRASLRSIFPIHSSARYHLFLIDMVAPQPTPPLLCSDVPQQLTPL